MGLLSINGTESPFLDSSVLHASILVHSTNYLLFIEYRWIVIESLFLDSSELHACNCFAMFI